jgi:carbon monoxide dehydrogenase subunit G
MKLSGSYQINLEKQKVWEALNDAEILKKSIPGCEKFIKNSDTEFTAKATIEGSGNSLVGFASGEAKVKLEDSNGGTKLSYEVEANVGGKIAQIGSRLIDMTAKKMADIFFGKFSELLSSRNISNENIKNERSETLNKISNKKFIYISLLVLLAIAGYFII